MLIQQVWDGAGANMSPGDADAASATGPKAMLAGASIWRCTNTLFSISPRPLKQAGMANDICFNHMNFINNNMSLVSCIKKKKTYVTLAELGFILSNL